MDSEKGSHPDHFFVPKRDIDHELNATYDELDRVVGSLDNIASVMHKITMLKNEIQQQENRNEQMKADSIVQRGKGSAHTATLFAGAG
ncbi:unnamed protein product, partial [Heterosigma akashiwo]